MPSIRANNLGSTDPGGTKLTHYVFSDEFDRQLPKEVLQQKYLHLIHSSVVLFLHTDFVIF